MLNIHEEVGARIRELRNHKDMSLEELAERSGVSKTPLSKLERGKSNVTLKTLARVANALEVSVAAIMDIEDPSLLDGTDELRLSELSRYLKKLTSKQQVDIIHIVKTLPEWGHAEEQS